MKLTKKIFLLNNKQIFFFSGRKKLKKKESKIPEYNIFQALSLAKAHSVSGFEESVETTIRLNINPKHGDQIVRGSSTMPYGLGKKTIVAFLTTNNELKEKAFELGADLFVDEKILNNIKNGDIKFEKLIATNEAISILKPFAKILGPKGLMPNQKVGTLVKQMEFPDAIKNSKIGQVTFRVDQGANIHALLGKVSFEDFKLSGNLYALMKALVEKKPNSVKGNYFLTAFIKTTMGPAWKINLDTIDPRNKTCLINE